MDSTTLNFETHDIDDLTSRINNLNVQEQFERRLAILGVLKTKIEDRRNAVALEQPKLNYVEEILKGENILDNTEQFRNIINFANSEKIEILHRIHKLQAEQQQFVTEFENAKTELMRELTEMTTETQNMII